MCKLYGREMPAIYLIRDGEIFAYHQNSIASPHPISSRFAVQLFSKQSNQFQFKNKIFYYKYIKILLN